MRSTRPAYTNRPSRSGQKKFDRKYTEIFKKVFAEAFQDLVEETKVTNGDVVFHLADVMQDIKGALDHLAMETTANKDIILR